MKNNSWSPSAALIMASVFATLGDEAKAKQWEAKALKARFPRVARFDALANTAGVELAAREAARGVA